MKENKYDDPRFFEKYSRMERSQKGLDGAGEWETLRAMLPDFKGKSVLDLGCGYGWHCMYAAKHGAASVTGIDISQKMLDVAKDKSRGLSIDYRQCAIEDVDFPDASFDIVISSLVFHYLEDFSPLVRKVFRMLRPGGFFVFSVEHPVFTAYGSQDWFYDQQGNILHFPVDNYFYEGQRQAVFLGEPVVKYHRTLTTYIRDLLHAGFIIRDLAEPMPPARFLDTVPGMRDELRRPMMLLIRAEKE